MIRGVLAGIAGTLIAIALLIYVGLRSGWFPANADVKPSGLERWAARTSLHATLARQAPHAPNPLPTAGAQFVAGIKLYAANCAVCHGASDGNASNVALGLYQKPPQFANDGVEDDPPGITYWKIEHGIRLTGMPAFGRQLDAHEIWQIALFLAHMDALPPAAQRVWKAVPSQASSG